MKSPEKSRKLPQGRKAKEAPGDTLAFSTRSYWVFGAAFASIIAGYIMLSKGSITVAPILLVGGYCVLVPIAIFVK